MLDTTTIDIAALAAPLGDAAPSGANLEYDPQFLALEQALRGTPEIEYGDVLTPAMPPDWMLARTLALQLMEGTRDLRLAVALARIQLVLDGVAGLAGGLALVERLLETQWDSVHPQLDPDDGFDPMLRVNVLAALVAPTQILRELREAPLLQVKALGSFSLRHIDDARDGADDAARSTLDAAFREVDQGQLGAAVDALRAALASVHGIEGLLGAHVGAGTGLDMAPLAELLARAATVLGGQLRSAAAAAPLDVAGAAAPPSAPAAQAGAIASRADVSRQLERLCDWYAEHEPASPVPLLLQRARRLVDKNFVELMQDLAPDGLGQLSRASGVQYES